MSVPMSPLQAVMRERVAAGLPPLASTPSADVTDEQLESLWRERVGPPPTGVVNVGYDPTFTGDVVFWAEHGGVRREQRRTREQFDDDPDLGYATVRDLVEQVRFVEQAVGVTALTAQLERVPPPADILDRIDDTVAERCACGCGRPVGDSVSAWFATDLCQWRWHNRHTTDPAEVYRRPDPADGYLDNRSLPTETRTCWCGCGYIVSSAAHPDCCADRSTVVLRHRRGTIERRYCYTDLLAHHPDDEAGIRAWLDDHGIDHATVPEATTIVVDTRARTVRVRVFLRNAAGHFYLTADGEGVAQATVTVRLRRPWPLLDAPRGDKPSTRRRQWRQAKRLHLLDHTYTPLRLDARFRVQHHQTTTVSRIHTEYHRRHK